MLFGSCVVLVASFAVALAGSDDAPLVPHVHDVSGVIPQLLGKSSSRALLPGLNGLLNNAPICPTVKIDGQCWKHCEQAIQHSHVCAGLQLCGCTVLTEASTLADAANCAACYKEANSNGLELSLRESEVFHGSKPLFNNLVKGNVLQWIANCGGSVEGSSQCSNAAGLLKRQDEEAEADAGDASGDDTGDNTGANAAEDATDGATDDAADGASDEASADGSPDDGSDSADGEAQPDPADTDPVDEAGGADDGSGGGGDAGGDGNQWWTPPAQGHEEKPTAQAGKKLLTQTKGGGEKVTAIVTKPAVQLPPKHVLFTRRITPGRNPNACYGPDCMKTKLAYVTATRQVTVPARTVMGPAQTITKVVTPPGRPPIVQVVTKHEKQVAPGRVETQRVVRVVLV